MKETVLHAIIESHIHWLFDIVMRFQGGDSIHDRDNFKWISDNSDVKCQADYCPLCSLFQPCGLYSNRCPLAKIRKNCNKYPSPWTKFMWNPCLETAQAMADVLGELALNYGVTVTPMEEDNEQVRKY